MTDKEDEKNTMKAVVAAVSCTATTTAKRIDSQFESHFMMGNVCTEENQMKNFIIIVFESDTSERVGICNLQEKMTICTQCHNRS